MKLTRRQIEEVKVVCPNSKREKVIDNLQGKGYTILFVGPHIKDDGWSWDLKRSDIVASRPKTGWKPIEEI